MQELDEIKVTGTGFNRKGMDFYDFACRIDELTGTAKLCSTSYLREASLCSSHHLPIESNDTSERGVTMETDIGEQLFRGMRCEASVGSSSRVLGFRIREHWSKRMDWIPTEDI